jgi:hypothetical protein
MTTTNLDFQREGSAIDIHFQVGFPLKMGRFYFILTDISDNKTQSPTPGTPTHLDSPPQRLTGTLSQLWCTLFIGITADI